jgi:hypothetical protein
VGGNFLTNGFSDENLDLSQKVWLLLLPVADLCATGAFSIRHWNLEAFQCFLITFAIDMMDHKIRYDFLYDWAVNADMFDP